MNSLRRFFAACDREALNEALNALSIDDRPAIKENIRGKAFGAVVEDWATGLADREKQALLRVIETAGGLLDEIGWRAVRAEFFDASAQLAEIEAGSSGEARALLAFARDAGKFERAANAAALARRSGGRDWQAFVVEGGGEPCFSADILEQMRAVATKHAPRIAGSELDVVAEEVSRPALDGVALVQLDLKFATLPRAEEEFEKGEVETIVRQLAKVSSILYDPSCGLLEVTSAGGDIARAALAEAFACHALGSSDAPAPVASLPIDLERLRRQVDFDHDPADGIKSVQLRRLVMHEIAGDYRPELAAAPGSDATIWEHVDKNHGTQNLLRDDRFEVHRAEFTVKFEKIRGDREPKTIAFALTRPDKCDLKNQRSRERLILERYLPRWGLRAAPGAALRRALPPTLSIRDLFTMFELSDKPISARAFAQRWPDAEARLAKLGLLRTTWATGSTLCRECGELHSLRSGDGGKAMRIFCPKVGEINLTEDDLRLLGLNAGAFTERIASILRITPAAPERLCEGLWRLGEAFRGKASFGVVLATPAALTERRAETARRLASLPAFDTCLVLASGGAKLCADFPSPFAVVEAQALFSFGVDGLRLQDQQLLRELRRAGLGAKKTGAARMGRGTKKAVSQDIADRMALEGVVFASTAEKMSAVREEMLAQGVTPPSDRTLRRHLTN